MSQRVFRETQEEKEGKRGAIGGGGGGRERERHIHTERHTHRDREREEGRGRDTEVGCLSVCAVVGPAPALSPGAALFSEPHWNGYTCSFQLRRQTLENMQSKRGNL